MGTKQHSDKWRRWHPSMDLRCDTCKLPVAPVSAGWAVVLDNPDVNHDWSKGQGHVHTVDGESDR